MFMLTCHFWCHTMIKLTEISPPIKLPGESSLKVDFEYNQIIVNLIKQISDAKWHKKEKCWEIPITSLSACIRKLNPYDDIQLNLLKDEDEKEDIKYELANYKTTPYEYQKEGINYGLNHDRFLLLDAPGLGKSLQMIYLAQELKERENIEHCLIICGINTLKYNWKKEIQQHSNLSCRILGERTNKKGRTQIGSMKDRLEDLQNKIDEFFIITNVETLRNDDIIKGIKSDKVNKIDMIVVDELHTMKSPTSQQGKNLLKLSAKHMVGLSGTLIVNTPLDAYVPLKWLGFDHSTYTNFKFFYCIYTGPFNNILEGYKNISVLQDQIKKHSLRRDKSLLDLPEKTIIHEHIELNDGQRKLYDNVFNGITDEIDKAEINTATLLSIIVRLRQILSAPSMLTTENIMSSKLERAVSLAEDIISQGEKVVIFSVFKETLNLLAEKLKDYRPLVCTGDIADDIISNNIDMFQNDNEHKIILATTAKMGTGITLTRASYAIFIDTPWTAAQCQQCEDRVHRIGSNKNVTIYYLWNHDTIDDRVKEIVADKEAISKYMVSDNMTDNQLQILQKYIFDCVERRK